MKSRFWDIAQELYQEWYLGFELYEEVEKKSAKTDFKKGYIKEEVVLADITKVNELLTDLKNGFKLVATGRPRTETLVPFETISVG